MSYRPITDVWILARPKVKYYGAYPNGFLQRARVLLGVRIDDPVLHVCGGKVREYPGWGFGPNDRTMDIRSNLRPDYIYDVTADNKVFPGPGSTSGLWPAMLADPPYTEEDALKYADDPLTFDSFPSASKLLKKCLTYTRYGGRVGMLHYIFPRPPKEGVKLVACIGVIDGYGNRMRCFSVFENRA